MSSRALVGVVLGLALYGACAPNPNPSEYEAEYLLVDRLDTAIMGREDQRPPSAPHLALGYDRRRVLIQTPPSELRFPDVPSGPGARFLTAPTLDPKAWTKKTDGVRFEALCRGPEGGWIPLLELLVSPAENPDDRRWHEHEAPLERCSVPATELLLRTDCGPHGNCAADWAAWGDPRVRHQRSLELAPDRLVLLISVDTLRPDRLGVYGASRPTSPELEKLAADGIVFETAVASSPWTIPSHATMLTSTYPRVHGADAQTPISGSVPALAEVLSRAGWQTAGFIDTPYLSRSFGFERGFEHYDDQPAPKGDYRRGAPVTRQRLLDWLTAADERPAFVFWHIMDVHGPYWAPAPFGGRFRSEVAEIPADGRLDHLRKLGYHDYLHLDRYATFEDLVAAYDEGIAATDAAIGRLLDVLRAAGLYDQTLIVVSSDHGESFLDHGVWVGHGLFLTDDEIRVPLIVKLPGNRRAGERIDRLAGVVDIAPSILDAVGIEPPAAFQGRSLLAGNESDRRLVYGFSDNLGAGFLRTGELKYVEPARVPPEVVLRDVLKARDEIALPLEALTGEQLYRLQRDPRETTPLDGDPGSVEVLERLRSRLAAHAAEAQARAEGRPAEAAPELSEEDLERLRALGYVD